MRTRETERVIADLNDFLKSRHPGEVRQFIASSFIHWTHFKNKPQNVDLSWRKFADLLRIRFDQRLAYSSIKRSRSLLPVPTWRYAKKKIDELAAYMAALPPDDAMELIVEITVNWCFSIPSNFLSALDSDLSAKSSEQEIADAIYTWFSRYNDLWH